MTDLTFDERRMRRQRFAADAIGTVVLGVPAVWFSPEFNGGVSGISASTSTVIIWSILLVAPLAWRRAWPMASTLAVALAALGHVIAGIPIILPADLAILAALYSITVHGPVWAHRTALFVSLTGAGILGFGPLTSRVSAGESLTIALLAAALALAAWALGLVRRWRGDMLAALRDRAERLETERDQQAQIATQAERARIAREMHDIVAHSLSVMIVQADGGRYAGASDPAAAERALTVISETGRAALADMRRLLGVLREGPSTSSEPAVPGFAPAPLVPQQGASDDADLGQLIEQARADGLRVSDVRVGEPRRLPPGAGLTLHRVCQEALTNVRKHGGPDVSVTVVTRWSATAIELEVSDDGRGAAASDRATVSGEGGFGLLGMRERAAMFGGTVTAGPKPGGGWRVRFVMPLPETPKEI
ncbi:MAG: sensor histidine kinase [Promicromonosporaceae bacterium]|nr:sensor histidine kinase [Promicromonosporaceae bacterium]